MKKIYTGHEVVRSKNFVRYAFAHELMGCEFEHIYSIKKEYVLLEKNKNGEYKYLNTNQKCLSLEYQDIDGRTISVMSCDNCSKSLNMDGMDCTLIADTEDVVIGVIDIQDIREVTRINDIDESIRFINEYNKVLQSQKKKVRKING